MSSADREQLMKNCLAASVTAQYPFPSLRVLPWSTNLWYAWRHLRVLIGAATTAVRRAAAPLTLLAHRAMQGAKALIFAAARRLWNKQLIVMGRGVLLCFVATEAAQCVSTG
jgi:hypothetical protein